MEPSKWVPFVTMALTLCGLIIGLVSLIRRGRQQRRQELREEFVRVKHFLLLIARVRTLERECNIPEGPSEYEGD
ncbi:MAG: hypothetical protein AB1752_13480 [Candidatus Zixiibacteriota bacterium]